jgi:hypothetical protein
VADWQSPLQHATQQTFLQLPAGADGGFLVPQPLSNFYVTGTFGPNPQGHVGINGGIGALFILYVS